jgi:hypothetical protein
VKETTQDILQHSQQQAYFAKIEKAKKAGRKEWQRQSAGNIPNAITEYGLVAGQTKHTRTQTNF